MHAVNSRVKTKGTAGRDLRLSEDGLQLFFEKVVGLRMFACRYPKGLIAQHERL